MEMHVDHKYLLVYGTLRPCLGTPMGRWLSQRMQYIGPGHVFGHLFDLGTYPGLILDDHEGAKIKVDIFAYFKEYEAALFLKLDQYEGITDQTSDDEYQRVITKVYTTQHLLSGWVYVLTGDLSTYLHKKRIICGDYCVYQNAPRVI